MDLSKINSYQKEEYNVILDSGLFDCEYYCKKYDLDEDVDPIFHYILIGVFKGYNPSPDFDTNYYLNQYIDVKKNKINPFVHYIKYGRNEGRIPRFLTDSEIEELGITSLHMANNYLIILHSGLFDEEYYSNTYSFKDMDPIVHYLKVGFARFYNPAPFFDTVYYLENHPEIKESNINPFVHFIKFGFGDISLAKKYRLSDFLNMNLNLSLKGKKGYIFLINDGNCELRQHFDTTYQNRFNRFDFLDNYYYKKNLFNENDMDYFFFNIPDKSVICKNLLPFDVDLVKRNISLVPEIIDFSDYLNPTHYYKWDSHLNYKGSEILSFKFLNHMDKELSIGDWNSLLGDNFEESVEIGSSDLLATKNWSYGEDERIKLWKENQLTKETIIKPANLISKDIWDDFKSFGSRDSFYWENPNSFSDKTALIFRDSTFNYFQWYFAFYFKEIFLYWDHGTVDDELIRLVNPDVIIEARVERFIENLITPDWVKNKENIFE